MFRKLHQKYDDMWRHFPQNHHIDYFLENYNRDPADTLIPVLKTIETPFCNLTAAQRNDNFLKRHLLSYLEAYHCINKKSLSKNKRDQLFHDVLKKFDALPGIKQLSKTSPITSVLSDFFNCHTELLLFVPNLKSVLVLEEDIIKCLSFNYNSDLFLANYYYSREAIFIKRFFKSDINKDVKDQKEREIKLANLLYDLDYPSTTYYCTRENHGPCGRRRHIVKPEHYASMLLAELIPFLTVAETDKISEKALKRITYLIPELNKKPYFFQIWKAVAVSEKDYVEIYKLFILLTTCFSKSSHKALLLKTLNRVSMLQDLMKKIQSKDVAEYFSDEKDYFKLVAPFHLAMSVATVEEQTILMNILDRIFPSKLKYGNLYSYPFPADAHVTLCAIQALRLDKKESEQENNPLPLTWESFLPELEEFYSESTRKRNDFVLKTAELFYKTKLTKAQANDIVYFLLAMIQKEKFYWGNAQLYLVGFLLSHLFGTVNFEAQQTILQTLIQESKDHRYPMFQHYHCLQLLDEIQDPLLQRQCMLMSLSPQNVFGRRDLLNDFYGSGLPFLRMQKENQKRAQEMKETLTDVLPRGVLNIATSYVA